MSDPLLLIPCVEGCGLTLAAQLPVASSGLESLAAAKDWILSVMTPPGVPLAVGLLCPDCAKRVHDPAVLDEMKRRRDLRIS